MGAVPKLALTAAEDHGKNNLPDVLARWRRLRASTARVENGGQMGLPILEQLAEGMGEAERTRTAQSFLVSKVELAANGYDLSLNRYKEVVHEAVEHLPPQQILASLAELEAQIQQGMKELGQMLKE